MSDHYQTSGRSSETEVSDIQNDALSESRIDRYSHFDGLYTTTQDLRIEGTAEGEIECEGTVTIAENARATATVNARNVIVAGDAEGDIFCREHFILQPTGTMRGQVHAASLSVEEGAFFEGEFRMVTQEEADTPTAVTEEETQGLLVAEGMADETDEVDEPPPLSTEVESTLFSEDGSTADVAETEETTADEAFEGFDEELERVDVEAELEDTAY
ncbi:MAG: polymer-forming cytoskeletal protein [Chloroflexota bacterium]|nr:polymer-forming cytoskeletal protein [Chloroflexota bacterium]